MEGAPVRNVLKQHMGEGPLVEKAQCVAYETGAPATEALNTTGLAQVRARESRGDEIAARRNGGGHFFGATNIAGKPRLREARLQDRGGLRVDLAESPGLVPGLREPQFNPPSAPRRGRSHQNSRGWRRLFTLDLFSAEWEKYARADAATAV